MDDAAVSIGGEAFTLLTVLFVAAMLGVVLVRALAKRGGARGRRDSGEGSDGGGYPVGMDGGSRRSNDDRPDTDNSDGGGDGDGGGGDGGGGGGD